jgi:hypothetical protein
MGHTATRWAPSLVSRALQCYQVLIPRRRGRMGSTCANAYRETMSSSTPLGLAASSVAVCGPVRPSRRSGAVSVAWIHTLLPSRMTLRCSHACRRKAAAFSDKLCYQQAAVDARRAQLTPVQVSVAPLAWLDASRAQSTPATRRAPTHVTFAHQEDIAMPEWHQLYRAWNALRGRSVAGIRPSRRWS